MSEYYFREDFPMNEGNKDNEVEVKEDEYFIY